jgi:hypothetical protein
MIRTIAVAALAATVAGCATTTTLEPVASTATSIAYNHGTPTTFSDKSNGAIQVAPLGQNDAGQPIFGIAAMNKTSAASDFSYDNLALYTADGVQIRLFDKKELERQATSRAMWASVAIAAAGAAASAAAYNNAYSTSTGTLSTPRGVYTYSVRTYDPGLAALNSQIATANAQASIAQIQGALQYNLANLNGAILQRTTIPSGQTYGGQVVADRLKSGKKGPQELILKASWNGEEHEFRFTVNRGK